MSEAPPRGNMPLTATQPSPPLGLDGTTPTPVDGVAVAPRPAPPRPGGSVPAPPRPSRIPPERSSTPPPPPRPTASAPPPRPSNPPAIPAAAAAPPAAAAPAPAAAAPPAAAAAPRRRSRRAVKVEEDGVGISEPTSGETQAAASVEVPAPTTDVIPIAPVAAAPAAMAPAVDENAEARPAPTPPEGPAEVIQPMRIISIGEDLPAVAVATSEPPPAMFEAAPPAAETAKKLPSVPPAKRPSVPPAKPASIPPPKPVAAAEEPLEAGWTPRPAEVATISAGLAADVAQALPPPPAAEVKPSAPVSTPPATTREAPELEVEVSEAEGDEELEALAKADEIDHFEEIEPERISDVPKMPSKPPAQEAQPAAASAPKKPPPPPPKKSTQMEAVTPPAAPPPPKAPPAAAAKPVSLPEPSRRRPRPWWEDLFDDDMIRTMDRVDAKVVHRDVDFIEGCLGLEKGATILDLACGTGQHAVELASRGYGVVGYDLSLNMLALAADEAQGRGQKLNFLQGDMREMAFDQVFDGLYCWQTSFGYFDDEKNFDVLRRMHRALRVGGILVLDIINRDYVAPRQPSLVWFEGDGCVCMDEMQVDFFTSRLKVKRTAMFDDGRAREIDYSLRLYALHEIGKIMHDADFKVVEVTGHQAHPGVFFGSESPRLIIVAERK